jgi:putative two-component system response regulator
MSDSQQATVLIVDDERGPRESLRMILAPSHRVLTASSGAEALELLHEERVDLMTLDLNMPGMHGQELMRTVRSDFPDVEIVIITGCGSVESAAEGMRSGICDYLQKPFDVVQVSAAVMRALSRQRARTRLSDFLGELGGVVGHDRDAHAILDDVHRSQNLRDRIATVLEVSGSRAELASSVLDPGRTLEFLEVLAETIEVKDRFMRGHARRVAHYSSMLAERLALTPIELEHVRFSAFLHDLGKVGVPTDLLLRAGALDPAERGLVEQHPEIGERLLQPLAIPASIGTAIRHHHEWWNGSGYPDGLAGTQIPLASRIVAVTDAYDAMSCDRPYRQALGRDAIVAEFERFAGVQFDPKIAKEFLVALEAGACDADVDVISNVVADVHHSVSATHHPRSVAG